MSVPRKRCPKCHARYEGEGVAQLHSCEVCGNGYLTVMPDAPEPSKDDRPMPRSGGGGLITHTREGF